MGKYRACETIQDEFPFYWVEKTDERYGYPAVIIPSQPHFSTLEEAKAYAKKLNEEEKNK